VRRALARGDEGELNVVGYGEISLGVGWPPEESRLVAKRMPPFRDRAAFDAYREAVQDYIARLEGAGVRVLETELRPVDGTAGTVVAYALQPLLPAASLGPAVLAAADPADGHPLAAQIVDATLSLVDPELGLDPQLANWSWLDGEAVFFDVTTPFLRDERGRDRMDFEVLLAAFPRPARGLLRRFVAPGIVAQYHDRRVAMIDACANLIKERLEPWIPVFLALAAPRLERPVAIEEVRRYYRSDSRTWSWIQRLRRADRGWHRLRGRTYPFLIPGEIER
jgi:Family of unknown function (DUF6206)